MGRGKKKYIETPSELYEVFESYVKDVKDNPRFVYDHVGRDGTEVQKKLERPLTMEGFRTYARKNKGSVEHYFANTDGAYSDYRTICRAITEEIRQDQIEGGMVGQYNASITQRLNGLVDKKEQTTEISISQITGMEIK